MGVLEDATEVLKNALVKENKPYTYKLLSRHLNIHVSDSKKLLYTFHQKYQDIVEATYLISGRLNNSTDLTIKVTKDINEKDKFDQIQSIQIYSLSPKNIEINEVLSTVNAQIREIPVDQTKLAKWGLIKGPELIKIDQPTITTNRTSNTPSTVSASRPASNNKTKETVAAPKENEFPDMGLRSAQILNRNRKTEEKPKERTRTQPTFGSSFKKTNAKEQVPVRSRTEPVSKSVGSNSSKPIELDNERTPKQNTIKAENDKKQKELESMFDDDDDEDLAASQSEQPEEPTEETNDKVEEETKEQESKAEDLEGIFDSSFSQSQSQQPRQDDTQQIEDAPEVVEAAETTEDPKLEESETTSYYDEDGYLVTEVKEKPKPKAQSKPKPKPKARSATPPVSQPASKKAKTGKTTGKQTSLMSFFGKK